MGVSSIALQGLQQAQLQLENSASKVAGMGLATTSGSGSPVDTVDLSKEMVTQLSAKNQYAVNLSVLKTGDQMMKTAIDMLA
jgi:flagellar hook protein FlgE